MLTISLAGNLESNAVELSVKSTILICDSDILSKTTLGYVCDVILLNNSPENEDPSDILTCPINSLVVGS